MTACSAGATVSAAKAVESGVAQAATDLAYANGTAQQNHAPADTGDFFKGPIDSPVHTKWVQLSATSAGGLSPIVENGAGFTLYRFDKDSPNPAVSNCNGACAATWPPVLVRPGTRVFLDGVPKHEVGVVRRADGALQLTLGGWPIYRFSKDTAPGQTNGEGVGGIWFAVSPEGMKVLPPSGSSATIPAPASSASASASASGGTSLGNGSVVLDSGANFQEPNGSQGVFGPGCQNTTPALAGSMQLSGGPVELFTGANCNGTSVVVSSDVADLSAIGFGHNVASILFGN
jgi:predicted lipoprotein with Yx(FWY)xxD motif